MINFNNKAIKITLDSFKKGEETAFGLIEAGSVLLYKINDEPELHHINGAAFDTKVSLIQTLIYETENADDECTLEIFDEDGTLIYPIVEFEVCYKNVSIEGYLDVTEADDEKPLRFYNRIGQEQLHFPSNPYPENLAGSYDNYIDYEHLYNVFVTTDIIQYLVEGVGTRNNHVVIDDDEYPTVLIIN